MIGLSFELGEGSDSASNESKGGTFWVRVANLLDTAAAAVGDNITDGRVGSIFAGIIAADPSFTNIGSYLAVGRSATNSFLVGPQRATSNQYGLKLFGVMETAGSGGGASAFTDLTDTPDALGDAGQVPVINPAGDGFIFADQTGGSGGGLSSVSSNDSLSGDGTSGSPLSVANPFTDSDEAKLDAIAEGAQVNVGQEFTLLEKSKLGDIEDNAKDDQTGAEIISAISGTLGYSTWQEETTGISSVSHDDTLSGSGTADSPLAIDTGELIKDLFGDFDESLSFTAINNFSITRPPFLGDWRTVSTGTLVNISNTQYAAGESFRGSARIRLDSISPPDPIKWRLLFSGGSEHLQTLKYSSDGNGNIAEDFNFNKPSSSNTAITWTLQILSAGGASGILVFADVILHYGDGEASASIRAEFTRDIQG